MAALDNTQQMVPSDNQSMMDEAAILSFIDDLIRDKNDSTITPGNVSQVREMLLEEVNNAINTHLVNLLSEPGQIQLDQLLDKDPSDDELNQFFLQKIPNLEIEIAAALLNFRSAYLYPVTQPERQFDNFGSPQSPGATEDNRNDDASYLPLPAPILPDGV